MSQSPIEAEADQNQAKLCTENVYAATPSSGSGGGNDDGSEDNATPAEQSAPLEHIYNYLETPKDETAKTVSEWVDQASTFNSENIEKEKLSEQEGKVETDVMEQDEVEPTTDTVAVDEIKKDLTATFKIFVSNLPPNLPNSELMDLFVQYGEVVECEIFAKNYAFVHMTSEDEGRKALEALNGWELKGCKINVKRSVQSGHSLTKKGAPPVGKEQKAKAKAEPKAKVESEIIVGTYKLFVGNLHDEVTKEEVSKLLEPFGRTVEVEIYRTTSAFVHMETEEAGKKAIDQLNGQTLPDCEKALIVSESKNPEGPSLATIKLKVTNFPSSQSADDIRNLFMPYGLVIKVVVLPRKDPSSNELRTAIVHLEQFGNIRSALKELNGKEIDGSSINVEATFNKPKQEIPKPKPNKYQSPNRPPPRPFFGQKNQPSWKGPDFPPHQSSPHGMRLIPMPSESELQQYPTSGTRGRRLLQPTVPPPPLMSQQPFPPQNTWDSQGQDEGYDYDNSYGYDESNGDDFGGDGFGEGFGGDGFGEGFGGDGFGGDGFGEGFGGNSANYDESEHHDFPNAFEEYDWSHYNEGNEFAPSPAKIQRNQSWNNSRNFVANAPRFPKGKPMQSNSNMGKNNQRNFDNKNNQRNFDNKNNQRNFDNQNNQRNFDNQNSQRHFDNQNNQRNFDNQNNQRNFDNQNNQRNFNNQNNQQNFGNKNNQRNFNNKNNQATPGFFPNMPASKDFSNTPKSLMSFSVKPPQNNDWSSDVPISGFSDFSCNQDFTSDQPMSSSLNAVPFDYAQMKKKNSFGNNRQHAPNFRPNPHSHGMGSNPGKGRKGNPRHPGLGSAQQQKKTANQTGESYQDNSTLPGEWQPVSISSLGGSQIASTSKAPNYFQQNWQFSKGKQNKKATAKQIKEAEEEQKKQYSDYLKQKPWLYQAIPGTVQKVNKF